VIGIGPGDTRYPARLLDLRLPPDPLWLEGDCGVLAGRAVSIVGTRRMTPYGARVARELASACADVGIVVVSGLAQGIDSAAHEGALDGQRHTVAVLGAGIASFFAEVRGRRRRLAHAIRSSGALISEFPPEAPPQQWTFARRDATIAALGEVIVVVEAPVGSGALITADEARKLGRPVYAVPGPIGVGASMGANALIATGRAKALLDASALLEAVGAHVRTHTDNLDDLDARILDVLAGSPADADALARRVGLDAAALSTRLARLVIRGKVAVATDGRFQRR